jgi:malate synthase
LTDHRHRINEAVADDGIRVTGPVDSSQAEILSPEALRFVAALSREFNDRRLGLLKQREARQHDIENGARPDFLDSTRHIREADWRAAPVPRDLRDRRVEITGPVDRKMVINALNSGASAYMADFEDSNAPTWYNNVQGQVNLRDAVQRTITFTNPAGKEYRLGNKLAVLMVRPRGWHLTEKHMAVDGEPVSGSLFDFGLYLFHNADALMKNGSGPYFYLPKLESHLEARLWNDAFNMAQDWLGIPRGTIRATVLIETILAAFEMDEILYELRNHSAGLNCGRWDYIFSFIKRFKHDPQFVLPDRGNVTMTRHFLSSYVELLIKTCHRRNIHAMGGMAAQIPIKSNPEANETAIEKVRQDKLREVRAGHDGTWVAHPALVPVARAVFDEHMKTPNQIDDKRNGITIDANDLLAVPGGDITEDGVRTNINVGIMYLEAWLRGNGCVPLYDLMEDAATAEISRSQVWQWIQHGACLNDGRPVSGDFIQQVISEELIHIRKSIGEEQYNSGRFDLAAELFERMMTSDDFPEFMPLVAYEHLD